MFSVEVCPFPVGALLAAYVGAGTYTDCYSTGIRGAVSLADYVAGFYTTPLFKLERAILGLAVARPSSDSGVRDLADGRTDQFAAWSVERRTDNQILLADFRGRTRSWLMVTPLPTNGSMATRLYFGSAVVPGAGAAANGTSLGPVFHALVRFHKLYSRALLYSARVRLENAY